MEKRIAIITICLFACGCTNLTPYPAVIDTVHNEYYGRLKYTPGQNELEVKQYKLYGNCQAIADLYQLSLIQHGVDPGMIRQISVTTPDGIPHRQLEIDFVENGIWRMDALPHPLTPEEQEAAGYKFVKYWD